jgi:hypothetical protein
MASSSSQPGGGGGQAQSCSAPEPQNPQMPSLTGSGAPHCKQSSRHTHPTNLPQRRQRIKLTCRSQAFSISHTRCSAEHSHGMMTGGIARRAGKQASQKSSFPVKETLYHLLHAAAHSVRSHGILLTASLNSGHPEGRTSPRAARDIKCTGKFRHFVIHWKLHLPVGLVSCKQ